MLAGSASATVTASSTRRLTSASSTVRNGARPAARDYRSHLPRFAGDANAALVATFAAAALRWGMTPGQLAIAWARAKQPTLVPVIGARTPAQLADALDALDRPLAPAQVAELEALVPPTAVAGTRYDAGTWPTSTASGDPRIEDASDRRCGRSAADAAP